MNKLFASLFILFFIQTTAFADLIRDDVLEEHLKTLKIEKPYVNDKYNYASFTKIPIKLKITEKITTKKGMLCDNELINFTVKEDVNYKGKIILKEGTLVSAKVATFIGKGMNGIPGMIIIENFNIEGLPYHHIKGTYIKKGLNLSLIVFPIKWALTPIPGVGSLTNFIVGGNAKISKRDTVVIYYYPEW